MCIDLIREVFPGAECEWERTGRVAVPMIVVQETKRSVKVLGRLVEVGTCPQYEMCDRDLGPGVAALKRKLEELKAKNS
eukprot:3702274-Pyramimonas_sp.AAC.1